MLGLSSPDDAGAEERNASPLSLAVAPVTGGCEECSADDENGAPDSMLESDTDTVTPGVEFDSVPALCSDSGGFVVVEDPCGRICWSEDEGSPLDITA